MSRVIVVGGGAAGSMAAYSAALLGHEVTLLEKNEKIGKKIYITGKGRCNATNASDLQVIFQNIVSNPKFLYSAMHRFSNQDMMAFLEAHGCALKIERGNRVFPVSDHSSDVIRALTRALDEVYVKVMLRTEVENLLFAEGADGKRVCGVRLKNGKTMEADAVILACGGCSYQSTGSTGDGYKMAMTAGHSMVKTKPALVPFETRELWPTQLQGLALKNVELTLVCHGRECCREQGEMLFTHFGVSGPLVLSASSYYVKEMQDEVEIRNTPLGAAKQEESETSAKQEEKSAHSAKLFLDLKPALDEETLDKRILRDFQDNLNKEFRNAIGKLFPGKMIPIMISLSGIPADKKVHDITKQERLAFVSLIKHLPMTIAGVRGFQEAIITQGGISTKEVSPSTMESKLCKGLFLTGEMLDLDALTGGYNLQIAWSTGYLAGESVEW